MLPANPCQWNYIKVGNNISHTAEKSYKYATNILPNKNYEGLLTWNNFETNSMRNEEMFEKKSGKQNEHALGTY